MAAPTRGVDRLVVVLLGVALIVAGVTWLLGSLFNLDLGRYGWPLVLIVPGLLLLLLGLATSGDGGGTSLAIGGSATLATGLLLTAQNVSGWWASWAYAWTLIAPLGIGVGLALYGWRWRRHGQLRNGIRLVLGGLALFVVGFLFFEGLIGLDINPLLRLNGTAWAVLLIAIGVAWLVVSFARRGGVFDR